MLKKKGTVKIHAHRNEKEKGIMKIMQKDFQILMKNKICQQKKSFAFCQNYFIY